MPAVTTVGARPGTDDHTRCDTGDTITMRYGRWLTVIAGAMAASALIGMTTTTLAWGQSLVEDERLLPGTMIAGVDVGERTADDAADEVRAHIEAQLETDVELTAAGERWVTSAADLDAEPDIE